MGWQAFKDCAGRTWAVDPDPLSALIPGAGQSRADRDGMRERRPRAMSMSMDGIRQLVDLAKSAIIWAKRVQSWSIAALLGPAEIPTGGASAGATGFAGANTTALAGGSALQGTATHRSTRNVGATLLSGTGTFLVGAKGMGRTPSGRQAWTMFLARSAFADTVSGPQTMIEGSPPAPLPAPVSGR